MFKGSKISVFCIYRPLLSAKNKFTPSQFIKELETFLDSFTATMKDFLVLGDFNFHFDRRDNTYVKQMLNIF